MLFLRGLRWRRGFSLAVLLVGAVCAAVAAIGPMYARAAGESTLTDALRDHAPGSGLTYRLDATSDFRAPRLAAMIGRDVRPRFYGTPIRGASGIVTAKSAQNPYSSASTLVWRDGQCAHVVLTTGRCPARRGEIMVPLSATTTYPTWRLGQSLVLRRAYVNRDGSIGDGDLLSNLRIVGVYRARDASEPYWFGKPFFRSTLGPAVSSAIKGGTDAVFVTQDQYTALPPATLPSTVEFDLPLLPEAVRLNDVSALRGEVAAIQRRFPRQAGLRRVSMRTELPRALAVAGQNKRQVNTATLVVVLELAALSLLVLFNVVGGAVAARGDEIALAKLRGLRPRRTIAFALGEPVVLLLLAAPIGFGVAVGVTQLLAGSALVAGTPVLLTGAVGWALLAAFAGSALAAVFAAVRTVTRPVLEQWRNTAPPRYGARWLLALDVTVAALAVATVVALQVGDHTRPRAVFLLAPVLLVFAVALIGMRLLPRVARLGLDRTRASRHVATFLALRQTVRRPSGLRLATLLVVAAGLATFAVCGEAVALGNRTARAHTEVGAPRRVAVQYEVGHDPEYIVRHADPRYRWAMTSASFLSDGGPTEGDDLGNTVVGPLLAVEPKALETTGYSVRGQVSTAALARDLTAAVTTPVVFRGTRLHAAITANTLLGDRPTVVFDVRTAEAKTVQANAARLRPGTGEYTANVDCARGCTFAGLSFTRSIDAQDQTSGSAVLTSVSVSNGVSNGGTRRSLPVRLNPRVWRGSKIGLDATTTFTRTASGLGVRFRSSGGASPVFDYADSPTRLPVVATPASVTTTRRTGGISDYLGGQLGYEVVRRASPLPVVLDTGALTNLDYVRTRLPNFDVESAWSVWLGPHAPADALARLERAGLLVEHVDTAAARVAALGRQGPALGLLLLLVCAVAAAVLAVGGTAVSVLAEARRRSFELAALRVVGVPQRTLRRSAVAEQALLLGAALVLAVPTGYAAAALVLPVVPEFADTTPVVLRFTPPVLVALSCAAGFGLLLLVTALIAGRALARAAVPARLREVGQ